jgi:hypothetical protein
MYRLCRFCAGEQLLPRFFWFVKDRRERTVLL